MGKKVEVHRIHARIKGVLGGFWTNVNLLCKDSVLWWQHTPKDGIVQIHR